MRIIRLQFILCLLRIMVGAIKEKPDNWMCITWQEQANSLIIIAIHSKYIRIQLKWKKLAKIIYWSYYLCTCCLVEHWCLMPSTLLHSNFCLIINLLGGQVKLCLKVLRSNYRGLLNCLNDCPWQCKKYTFYRIFLLLKCSLL